MRFEVDLGKRLVTAGVLLLGLLGFTAQPTWADSGDFTAGVSASSISSSQPKSSNLDQVTEAPSDPAPAGSPLLLEAPPGMTAVAGRVLQSEDGKPLAGVVLRIGNTRTSTDVNGLFLVRGIDAGKQVLIIDGRKAIVRGNDGEVDHGIYEARITVEAGNTTKLTWVSWLPIIDHANEVTINGPLEKDVVARAPAIPGLELRLPKGAVLTGIDGEKVDHVGLTAIPVNRTPYPLPRNVSVPVYFTAQPGGATISSANGDWLGAQVVYPNYDHQLPKSRGTFWRYEPYGQGWTTYGIGAVTEDVTQVVPDPLTRVYALTGAMFNFQTPAPNGPPPNPPCPCADPVDPASGLFVEPRTDLYLSDVLPIAVRRTYVSDDFNSHAFGVGTMIDYDMYFWSANQYQVVDLVMADGSRVHYTRIIDPSNPTDNGWITARFTTTSNGPFYNSLIVWNGSGWTLTRTDGTQLIFGDHAPLQGIIDKNGNRITITRTNGQTGNIVQVASPNGRFLRFTYDANGHIVKAFDNLARTTSYAYDSSGRMTSFTDADGNVTTYGWDSSNRMASVTNPNGSVGPVNVYNTSNQVIQQTEANGSTYKFTYSSAQPLAQYIYSSLPPVTIYTTTVTDPTGSVRQINSNSYGYIQSDIRGFGTPQQEKTTYTIDPTSNYVTAVQDALGRTTALTYDGNGNILTLTQLSGTANAVTTTLTYGAFNNPVSVTDPLGHTTKLQYDNLGNLTGVTDPLGHTSSFTYDYEGRVLMATDPLGNVASFAYTGADLASATDPLGRTSLVYADAIGRQLAAVNPLGARLKWSNDPLYGPLQSTNANGSVTTATYTVDGRLASVTDARGGKVAYTYDASDRLTTFTDAVNAVGRITKRDGLGRIQTLSDRKGQSSTLAYDPLGRLTSAAYADGSTVANTWDLGNRLTKVQDSVGGTITRAYDGLDRVTSETTAQGTVSYGYDAANRLTSLTIPGQSQVTYAYDAANRLTGITQGATSVAYTYDAASRRTAATLPNGITATYTYDKASELTGISYTNGSTVLGTLTYTYDLAGHVSTRGGTLFQSVLPTAVTSTTYNAANRLTTRVAAGVTQSPTYDANGSMISDGVNTYTWDARNRLTKVGTNGSIASFAYDAFGRRTSAMRGGTTTGFLYAGDEVVQEQPPDAAVTNLLVGLGTDDHLGRAGSTYLTDLLGSTVGLSTGTAVQTHYGYDPYGVSQTTGAASTNTFQYTGRENDATSTGLMYYRARYYNPAWGRFISEDPIGLAGGINRYAYAGGNPVGFRDPSGRNPILAGAIGGAIGGAAGSIIGQLINNGGRFECINWGWNGVGGAAAGGAIIGAAIGAGAGWALDAGAAAAGADVAGLAGDAGAAGTTGAFSEGALLERNYTFGSTIVGALGDVTISGSNLTISNIAIYAEGEGAASIGTNAVRSMFNSLATEARSQGFSSLTVSGLRYSGAGPGRVVTITRSW